MEEPKLSPFIEQPSKGFDYDKLREETTLPAIREIYKIIGDNADLLVFSQMSTEESITKNVGEVSQKVLQALIENKVANCDMQWMITTLQDTIAGVFSILSRQKNELEKEFMARNIESRDPGTGKFSREYATIADLFKSLETKRIEQDKEENQYFIVK